MQIWVIIDDDWSLGRSASWSEGDLAGGFSQELDTVHILLLLLPLVDHQQEDDFCGYNDAVYILKQFIEGRVQR